MDPCTLKSVSDPVDLASIEADWQQLFTTQPGAHLACSWAYIHATATQAREGSSWSCHLQYLDGCPAAGLFGTRRVLARKLLPLRVLDIGTEFASDVLLHPRFDDRACGSLLEGVMDAERECAMLQFGRLREPAFRMLRDILDRRRIRYSWCNAAYGFSWDTRTGSPPLESRLGSATRQVMRRSERKLARAFAVETCKLATTDTAANLEMLERFIALEAAGWKGREGTAIALRPGSADRFRDIVGTGSRNGLMHWYALNADGRTIAMNMCMRTHATLWMPKIAFDESYAEYRPGQELLRRVLLDCLEDHAIDTLDFIGAPEWLDNWRPDREPHFALRIFNRTLSGRLALALDRARETARSVAARDADTAAQERRFL